jgi:hypothetical protein
MKMLRFVTALGLVLVLAGAATAQGPARDGQLALLYNVDATALTYCTLRNGPFNEPSQIVPRIKTTGSSTTVTEFTASTNPFSNVVVGDVLVILTPTATAPDATTVVAVTAKASAASITVDQAINLADAAGHKFSFYHHVCGTTDADGWFSAGAAASRVALTVQYDQGDLGELVVRFEAKAAGAAALPVVLYPGGGSDCGALGFSLSTDRCSATTPGVLARLSVLDEGPAYAFYRVGFAYVTSDASDATTTREKLTIKVAVR